MAGTRPWCLRSLEEGSAECWREPAREEGRNCFGTGEDEEEEEDDKEVQ